MHVHVHRLESLAPVAVLAGLAVALIGLARLVQLVDDAHDVEGDLDET